MNRLIIALLALLCVATTGYALETAIAGSNSRIGDNLDLEAVASLFGEAESLEEFELNLNDPAKEVNNLDLNHDDEVDYLRVLEQGSADERKIVIQAVIGEDEYRDVATITVRKSADDSGSVQVVGATSMYGDDYVITPVYLYPPPLCASLWTLHYVRWHSPWRWGYYPPAFYPWRPRPVHIYRRSTAVYINHDNEYRRSVRARAVSGASVAAMTRAQRVKGVAAVKAAAVKRTGKPVRKDFKPDRGGARVLSSGATRAMVRPGAARIIRAGALRR